MINLVYVSVAAHPMSEDDLKEILAVSRRNNEKLNVTGMLLYRDGFFIQALEGPRVNVEPLYARIAQDPRHRNVLRVYCEPITMRSFERWTMSFHHLHDAELSTVSGYTDYLDQPFGPEAFLETPDRAHVLLHHFRDRTYF